MDDDHVVDRVDCEAHTTESRCSSDCAIAEEDDADGLKTECFRSYACQDIAAMSESLDSRCRGVCLRPVCQVSSVMGSALRRMHRGKQTFRVSNDWVVVAESRTAWPE